VGDTGLTLSSAPSSTPPITADGMVCVN